MPDTTNLSENMGPVLEPMDRFFAARREGYDEHMLRDVEGCADGYQAMAAALPEGIRDLLDLGCGTGLELDAIFPRFPDLRVTGVDLTEEMLELLRRKHPDKALTLTAGDYFEVPLGEKRFDAAVSFQSLHHFSHEKKLFLYQKICRALRPGGVFLDCDYMVTDPAEEALYLAEYDRLKRAQGLGEGYYHYDTPFTVEHEKALMLEAGFREVTLLFREENTTLLSARKG